MENPFQMLSQFRQNPTNFVQQQMLQRMEKQNPQLFQKVMGMVGDKNSNQMEQFARNLAKEQGKDINEAVSFAKGLFGMK